jgi:hypothetical protein
MLTQKRGDFVLRNPARTRRRRHRMLSRQHGPRRNKPLTLELDRLKLLIDLRHKRPTRTTRTTWRHQHALCIDNMTRRYNITSREVNRDGRAYEEALFIGPPL